MNTREKILAAVRANQPDLKPLPDLSGLYESGTDLPEKFRSVLVGIGATVFFVDSDTEVLKIISERFDPAGRKIVVGTAWPGFEQYSQQSDPHLLENLDLALIRAHFGVAENGAVWVTEDQMGLRALPFICQHLAVMIHEKDILPHMHAAYERIGNAENGFAAFIAGPSKTADIEQSLVLGAHGPISMTMFVVK